MSPWVASDAALGSLAAYCPLPTPTCQLASAMPTPARTLDACGSGSSPAPPRGPLAAAGTAMASRSRTASSRDDLRIDGLSGEGGGQGRRHLAAVSTSEFSQCH